MTTTGAPEQSPSMDIIEAYLEHVRQSGGAETTLDYKRKMLCRLDRELPYGLVSTTTEELAAWLYRDEWSQNSKASHYTTLKVFYAWATRPRDQWISFDPTEDLPPVRKVKGVARPVTDGQLWQVLSMARQPFQLWATIAAYQGLRCIEISRLDREHITEQNLIVVKGKGGRPRVHDTDPAVWTAVQDLPPGPIARKSTTGDRATANAISRTASRYFRTELELRGVTMHRFRHWLGVTVQREYKDPRVTQSILGHLSLQSTQIYTDATAEQQRAARAMLPRLAG